MGLPLNPSGLFSEYGDQDKAALNGDELDENELSVSELERPINSRSRKLLAGRRNR